MSKDHRIGLVRLAASACFTHVQQQPSKHIRVAPSSLNYLRLKGEGTLPCTEVS